MGLICLPPKVTWHPLCALLSTLKVGSRPYSTNADSSSPLVISAAGNTGPEILFQATSEEMIEAYSHSPRFFYLK